MDEIYLDHNSTTPIDPRVAETIAEHLRAGCANPASQHHPGRRARRVLETAREGIARLVGARYQSVDVDRVIFTSGGTEANNLAIFGLAGTEPGHAIVSAIEHPSVLGPVEVLQQRGWRIDRLGVDGNGLVDPDELACLLRPETRFVSVMMGNNETGVIEPVAQLAALCREAGVPMHTDAVQVAGKMPIEFRALDVATLSLAAHKFHGPRGIGVLIVRSDVRLEPHMVGGVQQFGLRPGTEPVALAAGMYTALQLACEELGDRSKRMGTLRDRLTRLLVEGWPDLVVNGEGAPRLPHTVNVSFRGLDRQALVMALDVSGVACSTGSACTSGSSEPSHVLLAMGAEDDVLDGSIRLSLGAFTTAADVTEAARRILLVANDLKMKRQGRISPAPGRVAGRNSL